VLANYWAVPEKNLADRALVAYDQKHYTEAFDLFNKAAESGNINAEYYLGIMYENGYGVEQNRSNALTWYSKAASHGHPLAGQAVERIQNVLTAP
jgi:TPR repeat protein